MDFANEKPLPSRTLGRTGLQVSCLGFGAAPIGDLYQVLDEGRAIGAVTAAYDVGMNIFDAAPLYGHGLAEHRCGTALRSVPRDSFLLSTKVGRWLDPFAARGNGSGYVGGLPHGAIIDYSYDGTMRSVEQSMLRLGVGRIDILLIHDVDAWTHGEAAVETRFAEAMEGSYRALARLRDDGVIKAIGVGVNDVGMCERFASAGDFDVMLLAGRYSLLEQGAAESFFPLAQRKGIGLLLGGVFNSGILATGARDGARYNYAAASEAVLARVRRIEAICGAHEVSLPDVALQFVLAHPAVSSVVLGAVSADEVRQNAARLSRRAPRGLWDDLKSERLLPHDAAVPS
ncbi:aldo/keto reductase [Bradyrhizobium sp.]|uniref:aldo/keto reductase n=1 Tax=Bradyrhizobium sp. TaxID=376 RepID=UPI0039E41D29